MASIFVRGAQFAYGLWGFCLFLFLATINGGIFSRASKKDKELLATAQDKFWNLSKTPFGLSHHFFSLRNGKKLHYVKKGPVQQGRNDLVIFIHGFPDSCFLWQNLLTSLRLAQNATLVAVDLPGYGGSDDLVSHGAEGMLEALAEFILAMRTEYPGAEGGFRQVIVVGHDWGCIVAGRLAAEAPQLADRFVLASAVNPWLMTSNAKSRFESGKKMFRTWLQRPTSIGLLRKALATISPVFSQLSKSFYVFSFQLPAPFANFLGRFGNFYIFRTMQRLARRQRKHLIDVTGAEAMAACVGPSATECHSPSGETGYPESVARRIPTGGWPNKLRVYREDLFIGTWSKSIETLFALRQLEEEEETSLSPSPRSAHRPSTTGLFDSGPPGAYRSPTTIVHGMKDPAFEPKLAQEGINDYLVKGSQLVQLEKGGHWLPIEQEGSQILEEIIAWCLEPGKSTLKASLAESCEKNGKRVKVTIET